MKYVSTGELLDLEFTRAAALFHKAEYPWEVLPCIKEFTLALGKKLSAELFEQAGEHIWIAKSAHIAKNVSITGPCIIDEEAEVRPGAFIRGSVIVGKNAVVGNSCELKNAVLFDGVQVPHFNYVGDSVLGHKAHMGAGAVTSNVKSDKTLVVVKGQGEEVPTGYKKFGAILGDFVEVGCNSVLNPGTVVGRGTSIYPLSCVRGVIPAGCIYKAADTIVEKR